MDFVWPITSSLVTRGVISPDARDKTSLSSQSCLKDNQVTLLVVHTLHFCMPILHVGVALASISLERDLEHLSVAWRARLEKLVEAINSAEMHLDLRIIVSSLSPALRWGNYFSCIWSMQRWWCKWSTQEFKNLIGYLGLLRCIIDNRTPSVLLNSGQQIIANY